MYTYMYVCTYTYTLEERSLQKSMAASGYLLSGFLSFSSEVGDMYIYIYMYIYMYIIHVCIHAYISLSIYIYIYMCICRFRFRSHSAGVQPCQKSYGGVRLYSSFSSVQMLSMILLFRVHIYIYIYIYTRILQSSITSRTMMCFGVFVRGEI